jgi:hypothetical protein
MPVNGAFLQSANLARFMLNEWRGNMKISEILNMETFNDPEEVELLKLEARHYLKTKAISQASVLAERSSEPLSPAAVTHFFRDKEREENTRLILQYMLAFLDRIPSGDEIINELTNPIKQFLEFVQYEVDLLQKKDIKKAILREYSQMGLLNEKNIADYEHRIDKKHQELSALIPRLEHSEKKIIAALCQALENLCLFWFDIKRGDIRRTRYNDIPLYNLARVLQSKYKQEEMNFQTAG